jgi:hypothetical protein
MYEVEAVIWDCVLFLDRFASVVCGCLVEAVWVVVRWLNVA